MQKIMTDHALLRYIERVYKVDVEKIRDDAVTDMVKAAIAAGANVIHIDGVKFLIKNGVIVTTYDNTMNINRYKLKKAEAA